MATNKVIIFIGQSNCLGAEPLTSLPAERKNLKLNLRVWNGAAFECIDSTVNNNQFPSLGSDYSYEFWLEDLKGFLNEDIYVLKYGVSGAYLANQGTTWNVDGTSLFDLLSTEIADVKAWMSARGKEYEFHCIVWHQGEADVSASASVNAYEVNENNLFSALNTEVGGDMFFYNIQLNDLYASGNPYKPTVVAAKVATTAVEPSKRRLIEQTGVTLQGDNTHLDASGTDTLGDLVVTKIKEDL